jgi:diacylglycerol kinase (ATP)
MNPCVILNPLSGGIHDLDKVKKQIEQLHPSALLLTEKPAEGTQLVREALASGCNYFIAAGGDGTLNEIVNGVANHSDTVRVGLIPLGTGNDFARSVKLPATVEENIDLLRSDRVRDIDLVRIRTGAAVHYFVNVSAGGFSGPVNEKLTAELKRTWGPLAYVRGAAAALTDLQAYRATIELDQEEKFSLEVYNVIVANGQYVAGGLPIAPQADLSDGWLDLILIPKLSPTEMVFLAAQIVLGTHLNSPSIVYRRTSRVAVHAEPGMWFNADGELLGNEPAMFEIIPRALHFVAPEK